MGVNIRFEIEGEKQIDVELGIAAGGMKDFREPLAKAAGILQKSFQLNYSTRGGTFQGGWPPRSKPYPWPILEKTGRMRRSFTDNVSKDFVVLWNKAPYFAYHQSNAPRTRLPRRIMIKLDQQRRNEVMKTIQEYIIKKLRGVR